MGSPARLGGRTPARTHQRSKARQRPRVCAAQASSSVAPARPQLVFSVAAASAPAPPPHATSHNAQLSLMLGWVACVLSGALAAALLAAIPALGEFPPPSTGQRSSTARETHLHRCVPLPAVTLQPSSPDLRLARPLSHATLAAHSCRGNPKRRKRVRSSRSSHPRRGERPRLLRRPCRRIASHRPASAAGRDRSVAVCAISLTTPEQVPETAATVRLSGLELSDTIEELGNLG